VLRAIFLFEKFKKEKQKYVFDENETDEEVFEGNRKMKCEVFLIYK